MIHGDGYDGVYIYIKQRVMRFPCMTLGEWTCG